MRAPPRFSLRRTPEGSRHRLRSISLSFVSRAVPGRRSRPPSCHRRRPASGRRSRQHPSTPTHLRTRLAGRLRERPRSRGVSLALSAVGTGRFTPDPAPDRAPPTHRTVICCRNRHSTPRGRPNGRQYNYLDSRVVHDAPKRVASRSADFPGTTTVKFNYDAATRRPRQPRNHPELELHAHPRPFRSGIDLSLRNNRPCTWNTRTHRCIHGNFAVSAGD